MRRVSEKNQIKVLIADDDNQLSRRLADHLIENGFEVKTASNGKDARSEILNWKPKFVLADLMLPEGNALELIDFIRQEKQLRHSIINTIVMSGHNLQANVRLALARGAKDYIVKPFRHEDILKRLVFHSRNYRRLNDIAPKELLKYEESGLMLHLTDLVLRQALGDMPLQEILFNLTRMVTMRVDGVRCNIVQCFDQKLGVVVISNDNPNAAGIHLDLYKYPEILHVMNTGVLIAIENIEDSVELRHIKDNVKNLSFNSMIVCPISRCGIPFGVLSLRMPPEKTVISDNEIRFVEIVSHIVSLVVSNNLHVTKDDFWMHPDSSAKVLSIPRVKG